MPTERRRSKEARRRVRRAATYLAPAALGICLVVSPQLLGGAFGWGVAIIAGLAGIACLAAVWTARRDGLEASLDLPAGLLLGLLLWTVLQATPLPRAVTEMLQPEAVAMADASARLIEASPPAWVPLSLSPGSTRAEIVKGAGIVAAFFAAWLLVSLGHRRRVGQLVALSTLTMAVVALAHLAADAERVFGVYAQMQTASSFLAPLLNQNHLGGFLAMGVPLAIGLGLDERDPGKRLTYLGAATVIGASVLLCVSRGGVAGLVCGLLALGTLGLARTRKSGDVGTTYATIGAAVAAIAGLGLYVGAEALYRDFEHGDASKLELGANGMALALDHPWVGVGRGAFSAAFVSQHGSSVRYTHPENLLAQWTSEWGLVVALGVLALLGWAFVRSIGVSSSWTRLGAAAGVVAIVVHDLVDFALEMAGVAVVAAALLAVVIAPRRRSRRARSAGGVRAWHGAALAGGGALLATLSWGWSIDRDGPLALQQRLTEQTGEAFRATLLDAVRLHPAEPVFPLLAGAAAVQEQDERAVLWLNRAMVLAPGWASPHVETARFLARRGRVTQAFLELREAEERQGGRGAALTCTILERRPSAVSELLRVAGDGALASSWLDRVARCLPVEHEATIAIDAHLIERGGVGARVREARRLTTGEDARGALAVLDPVRDEPELDVQLARAQALTMLNEHDRALRVLERAESLADRPERVLGMRARVEASAGDAEAMRETMQRVRSRARGRGTPLAAAWVAQGRLEQSMGNEGAALAAFMRAHDLDPASPGLANAAALAERTGDLGRALRAYGELCRGAGDESPHCAARDRVRERDEARRDESLRQFVQPPATP